MIFRIADTFTRSLAGLNGEDQKLVKTTAFDLQMNPVNPGHQFHKLDKAKDKNFWSVRVSRDIRMIVHRNENNLLLCYVDHHDRAYHWAERRKIQAHPRTGAAQIVELKESIQEITVPIYKLEETVHHPLENFNKDDLLEYGVPEEWIEKLLSADEEDLLEIAERLPQEASEAVLNLATGNNPQPVTKTPAVTDPFDHPDARRRFRVMENRDELERALDAPWEQWAVFLHPTQQSIVEGSYRGPVRVSGSAGTGKTIVALHRAVFLARKYPDSRILLTTFSESLADALNAKLRILIYNQPRLGDQIEVQALDKYILKLHRQLFGNSNIVDSEELKLIISRELKNHKDCPFNETFLIAEWSDIIDQRQISTWEEYKNALRLGRRRRLAETQRETVWNILSEVNNHLSEKNWKSLAGIYADLEDYFRETGQPPFNFIIVDEAQDISISALRLLSAFNTPESETLFFAGDLGQRIFQQPFSWKSQGINIQGRSHILRVNYRTSHQIRSSADKLLDKVIRDADGNVEERTGTVSVFNGLQPRIELAADIGDEITLVADWIKEQINNGDKPDEIGVIVRSDMEIPRALEAIKKSEMKYSTLGEGFIPEKESIVLTTMHKAKGLEFKSVVVMACDDDVIPSRERIESVGDDSGMEEVYNTERHLLYVACTRARDKLLVTGIEPGSEFLEDMVD